VIFYQQFSYPHFSKKSSAFSLKNLKSLQKNKKEGKVWIS
jgi:hypothetical protein